MRRLRLRAPAASGPPIAALAPLVDVLTLLVVVLLRVWSADPPLGVDDLVLPPSASSEAVPHRLAVDVTPTAILVDGRRVVGTAWYDRPDELLVREVYDALLARGGEPVALRVDGRVSYRVLRRVLASVEAAGVADVTLVAESRASL